MRLLGIALFAAVTLSACATIPVPALGAPPACVTRYAQALTTTKAPVKGAYACQSAALQKKAAAAGIHNDADLQTVAGTAPVLSNPRYVGALPDGSGYEYFMAVDGLRQPVFIWADASGKVLHFTIA